MAVKLVGWKVGMHKIGLTRAIQSYAGLSLSESHRMTSQLIARQTIFVESLNGVSETAFIKHVQSLGVVCEEQPLIKTDFLCSSIESALVLQRAFDVMQDYSLNKDRFGMAFAALLASLLGQLPGHISGAETLDETRFWKAVSSTHDKILLPYANDIVVIMQGSQWRGTENFNAAPAPVAEFYSAMMSQSLNQLHARWATDDLHQLEKSSCHPDINDMGHVTGRYRNTWRALNGQECLYWNQILEALSGISALMLNWDADGASAFLESAQKGDSPIASFYAQFEWKNLQKALESAISHFA